MGKYITEDFTLEELYHSNTAIANGIDNTPNAEQVKRLTALTVHVLQPTRNYLKHALNVNVAFRCMKLNLKLKGSLSSQHLKGEAADLDNGDGENRKIFDYIRENLEFDQLILEGGTDEEPGWIHVSYSISHNRKQVLEKVKGATEYTLFED